jgi:subtilisin family serine protease
MNNPISATIATCTLTLLSLSCVVADVTNDVRNTGAFLVKLRPDAVPKSLAADQWELSPLLSERVNRDESTSGRQWWYLALRSANVEAGATPPRPEQEVNPWDTAYALYEGSEPALTAGGITKEQIQFIEPDLAYRSQAEPQPSASPSACSSDGATAIAGSQQSKDWPRFQNVGDFQELQYSQIKAARNAVKDKLRSIPLENVRVAFLDTGYDPQHVACPKKVNAGLARNFVEYDKKKNPDGAPLKEEPGPQGSQHHGTGTIGIFGAGRITLCGPNSKIIFDDILGTAPMVEIIPMRVAKSPVHLDLLESRSSGTTRAIWYAWENNCDVISMSHGGLPSKALAEAINAAYDKGVAMFFASGDYLKEEPGPIQTPRYVVYPAAFSRTMCVCGVTGDLKTEKTNPAR